MSADVDPGAEARRIIRRERWQGWLAPVGLVLVLVILVGAVVDRVLDDGWHEASFRPNRIADDSRTLPLFGGDCDLELRATVSETREVVSILLEEYGRSDDDCGNATQVALSEPIGERDVVDESTGQRWRRDLDPDKPRKWVKVEPAG